MTTTSGQQARRPATPFVWRGKVDVDEDEVTMSSGSGTPVNEAVMEVNL
jgi:hypothetical protein